jgi:hypothetical protein
MSSSPAPGGIGTTAPTVLGCAIAGPRDEGVIAGMVRHLCITFHALDPAIPTSHDHQSRHTAAIAAAGDDRGAQGARVELLDAGVALTVKKGFVRLRRPARRPAAGVGDAVSRPTQSNCSAHRSSTSTAFSLPSSS